MEPPPADIENGQQHLDDRSIRLPELRGRLHRDTRRTRAQALRQLQMPGLRHRGPRLVRQSRVLQLGDQPDAVARVWQEAVLSPQGVQPQAPDKSRQNRSALTNQSSFEPLCKSAPQTPLAFRTKKEQCSLYVLDNKGDG